MSSYSEVKTYNPLWYSTQQFTSIYHSFTVYPYISVCWAQEWEQSWGLLGDFGLRTGEAVALKREDDLRPPGDVETEMSALLSWQVYFLEMPAIMAGQPTPP